MGRSGVLMNLIYQYYKNDPTRKQASTRIGINYPDMSKQSISRYAYDIGCEYKMLRDDIPFSTLYGIFLPFLQGWCHDYETICFIDSDIMSTTHGYNILDEVVENCLVASCMNTASHVTNGVPVAPEPFGEKGHCNSGVVMFHKGVYDRFTDYIMDEWVRMEYTHKKTIEIWGEENLKMMCHKDQELINNFVVETGMFSPLHTRYNWQLNRYATNQCWDQQFIHYIANHKAKMPYAFEDERILK
jgi:hypothetical protein